MALLVTNQLLDLLTLKTRLLLSSNIACNLSFNSHVISGLKNGVRTLCGCAVMGIE